MNYHIKSNICFGLLLLLFTACEPIEKRDKLTNSFNPNNIEMEVTQSTSGGNNLSIKMKTSGVTGYWDYNIDKKFTNRVEVIYPIPGKSTFTYYVSTAYMPNGNPAEIEYISKSIDVQIDTLDHELPQAYYDLIGTNLEGKSWIFNGVSGDGSQWWYMCPQNDPTAWDAVWWNAGDSNPPADAEGSMTFDLNGAANYTYKTSDTDNGALGSFKFNADFTKLTFIDQPILGYDADRVNLDSEYVIIHLNADELILYTPTNNGGTGWTWVFKSVTK